MKLCPCFFKNHHPNLPPACRFGKHRSIVRGDWDIIINYNFLKDSLIQYSDHVDAIWAHLQARKQIFNSKIVFCQCRNCTKEIAVTDFALDDICWLHCSRYKLRIFNHLGDSFPVSFNNAFFHFSD